MRKDRVLHVHFPKTAVAQPKAIEITVPLTRSVRRARRRARQGPPPRTGETAAIRRGYRSVRQLYLFVERTWEDGGHERPAASFLLR